MVYSGEIGLKKFLVQQHVVIPWEEEDKNSRVGGSRKNSGFLRINVFGNEVFS
jgi:hypothetical protein